MSHFSKLSIFAPDTSDSKLGVSGAQILHIKEKVE